MGPIVLFMGPSGLLKGPNGLPFDLRRRLMGPFVLLMKASGHLMSYWTTIES